MILIINWSWWCYGKLVMLNCYDKLVCVSSTNVRPHLELEEMFNVFKFITNIEKTKGECLISSIILLESHGTWYRVWISHLSNLNTGWEQTIFNHRSEQVASADLEARYRGPHGANRPAHSLWASWHIEMRVGMHTHSEIVDILRWVLREYSLVTLCAAQVPWASGLDLKSEGAWGHLRMISLLKLCDRFYNPLSVWGIGTLCEEILLGLV